MTTQESLLDPTIDPLENSPNKVIQPSNLHDWKYYDPGDGQNIPSLENVDPEEGDDEQNSLPISVSFNSSQSR